MRRVRGARQAGVPRAQGGTAAGVRPLPARFPLGLPGPPAAGRARGAPWCGRTRAQAALHMQRCCWGIALKLRDWRALLPEATACNAPLDLRVHGQVIVCPDTPLALAATLSLRRTHSPSRAVDVKHPCSRQRKPWVCGSGWTNVHAHADEHHPDRAEHAISEP